MISLVLLAAVAVGVLGTIGFIVLVVTLRSRGPSDTEKDDDARGRAG